MVWVQMLKSELQRDLMRAACRMTRWIDPDRPQELTPEETRPPPRYGAEEVEAPLPGHGDAAARLPDHRPRDLQHMDRLSNIRYLASKVSV